MEIISKICTTKSSPCLVSWLGYLFYTIHPCMHPSSIRLSASTAFRVDCSFLRVPSLAKHPSNIQRARQIDCCLVNFTRRFRSSSMQQIRTSLEFSFPMDCRQAAIVIAVSFPFQIIQLNARHFLRFPRSRLRPAFSGGAVRKREELRIKTWVAKLERLLQLAGSPRIHEQPP